MGKIYINRNDVIWSYVGNFFRISTSLIILPLVLKYLSDDELGLWYVFSTIGAFVILLDFGFAPSLSRNIAYIWCGAKDLQKEGVQPTGENQTDLSSLKLVLYTCKRIYLIISLIALALLLFIGIPYILHISSSEYLISWLIYTSGVFLNLLYSYYTSILRGIGAIAENNKAAVFSRLVQIVITLLFLLNGYGLIGVSLAYLLSGITLRVVSNFYFNKYDDIGRRLKPVVIHNANESFKRMFTTIWFNASKDGLVTLSNYLATQANTLICSSVLGLSTTGSYGFSMQIITVVANLSIIPFSTYMPKLQETSVKGDKNNSLKLFSRSIIMYLAMFVLMVIGCIIIFPIILYLKPSFSIDRVMFLLLAFYMIIYHFYHLFASYISTYNMLPYTKAFIVSAVISTLLSFLIARFTNVGIWAIIICPLFVSMAYNAWKWPHYALKKILEVSPSVFILTGLRESLRIFKRK